MTEDRINAQAVFEMLVTKSPRSRLKVHRDYWIDPPDIIREKFDLLQLWIDDDLAHDKQLLLLSELDNYLIARKAKENPDRLRGEQNKILCKTNSRAKKERTWAKELTVDLLKRTTNFQIAWNKIPENYEYSDELPIQRTTKDGIEGIEYLLGREPHPFLTKESFRTGYFQPVKKNAKRFEE